MIKKPSPKPNASWAFEVEKINAWAYWDQAFTPEECQKIINYELRRSISYCQKI